jgi:hypothetical protein
MNILISLLMQKSPAAVTVVKRTIKKKNMRVWTNSSG